MKWPVLALLIPLVAAGAAAAPVPARDVPPVATFSIVARDPATGDLGVAVQSRFFGVGAVVPWAKADVGAIATQAWANTTYGPRGLEMLAAGKSPQEVVTALTKPDAGRDRRQLGIVDAKGRSATFTGEGAQAWAGHAIGPNYACQGNILAGEAVVKEMEKAFLASKKPLPERLVDALAAGQAAGGDKRGMQSAALLVVRKDGGYAGFDDRYMDLRVDDHEKPIEELARLVKLHRETFGRPVAPVDVSAFEMEPEPEGGPLSSPRATFETWARRFRARKFEALFETQAKTLREKQPFDEWKAALVENATTIDAWLDRAEYAGTRIDGDRAMVAIRTPGGSRPSIIHLRREEGEWRLESN